jgi:hypothetical protein
MNKNQLSFVETAEKLFGIEAVIDRNQIQEAASEASISFPYWFVNKSEYKAGRNQYQLPKIPGKTYTMQEPVASYEQNLVVALRQPKLVDESDSAVPAKYPDYIPFGFYKDLFGIIKSKTFYPVFITGLSGNGKTLMVEQICAEQNRECIRVNISIETDDTDLLGGYQLINGNTVYKDGPIIQAMKRGAVCLIDEVDRGSNKLMCLQGILEGKPYYNKKTGEVVSPTAGFTVIATANTKGRGSEEGRYLSQILDDAFLERFPITVEQEYPDTKTEKKILGPLIADQEFVDNLVQWADVVRQTFEQGAVDEIISTRRLVHIAKAYKIFGDRMKSIELCVNRFDTQTKEAFLDLYSKVDAKVVYSGNNTTEMVANQPQV